MQAAVDEVVVKALKYSACVDVIDSDHKPVWALLALEVPVTNQEKKRRMCSHILKQTANQGQALERPALQVSCDNVQLNQVRLVTCLLDPQLLCCCRSLSNQQADSLLMLHQCSVVKRLVNI